MDEGESSNSREIANEIMSRYTSSSSGSRDLGERHRGDLEDQDGNDSRNIFRRQQEERQLGPPERADDLFGATENPKKMRESRQLVTTISKSNKTSVAGASQSPEIVYNKIKTERILDQVMDEVMNQSSATSEAVITPDHRGLSLLTPKDEPQSQESGENIENGSKMNRVMRDVMNQSDSSFWEASMTSESSTSDDEESPEDSLNPNSRGRTPDHQENEENKNMMTRVMTEVINLKPVIKTESMTPGDSRDSIAGKAFNLSDIKTERRSPRRQDSPHLEEDALDNMTSCSQLTTPSPSLIDPALDSQLSQVSSDESMSSSGSCGAKSDKSLKLNRLIARALEGRVSSDSDSSEVSIDDGGDSDDEDDEFSPQVRPKPSNREEERTVNQPRRRQEDYYFKKHYTVEENRLMIDILIRDNRILCGSSLRYWGWIAEGKCPGLKGRSGRSLLNHFMGHLLQGKVYAAYTRDPLALEQFEALYEAKCGS